MALTPSCSVTRTQYFPSEQFADAPDVNLERGTINGVPAVMPGFWGDHLGVVDLTLTGRERRLDHYRLADRSAAHLRLGDG